MSTAPQLELLDCAVAVLREDDRILAAWLGGSFGSGYADAWSDLDVHCLIDPTHADELRGSWKDVLARITPTVMATTFPPPEIGGFSLTPEWLHLDLVFRVRGELDVRELTGIRPLFDRTGLLPAEPVPQAAGERKPYFPADQIDFFFYVLGTLPLIVGRDEPVLGTSGALTLREVGLIPVLYGERGVRRSGGVKRLNPFLSPEQRALLESLPPLVATIEAVVAYEVEISRIVIERGRALAAQTDATWPAELESSTLAHLESELSLII